MACQSRDITEEAPTDSRVINVDWATLARIFAIKPESGPWQARLDPRSSNTRDLTPQAFARRVVVSTVICAVLVAIGRVLWTHFGPIAAAPLLLIGARGLYYIISVRPQRQRRLEQSHQGDERNAGASWDRVMHAVEHGKPRVFRIRDIHGAAIWVDVSAFVMLAVTMYFLSVGSTIFPLASLSIGCGPWPLIIIAWLLVQTRAEWLLRVVRKRARTGACIRCGYALPPKPIDTGSSLALHCCPECGLHGLVRRHPDPA